jgi:hypothetical protein
MVETSLERHPMYEFLYGGEPEAMRTTGHSQALDAAEDPGLFHSLQPCLYWQARLST